MKAITCPIILGSIATKADGSLALRFSTPELTPEDKLAFLELQNKELTMLLQPCGEQLETLQEVKGEFDTKTPSQRMRACLFLWWKQLGQPGEFSDFYLRKMEAAIDSIKKKLETPH